MQLSCTLRDIQLKLCYLYLQLIFLKESPGINAANSTLKTRMIFFLNSWITFLRMFFNMNYRKIQFEEKQRKGWRRWLVERRLEQRRQEVQEEEEKEGQGWLRWGGGGRGGGVQGGKKRWPGLVRRLCQTEEEKGDQETKEVDLDLFRLRHAWSTFEFVELLWAFWSDTKQAFFNTY